MADAPTILTPQDMSRLANYRFAVRMMVEGWLSGPHRAKGRGSSSDFLEYRAYYPGDDPRLIDWRVFARNDKMQLKTFEHESHVECHIFLDASASMGYKEVAPISKLQYAAHFAACVAWLVVRGHDRVSLQIFDETIRSFLPPGSTATHLNQCLHLLEHVAPGNQTNLPQALVASQHLLERPATVMVISDFCCDTDALLQAFNMYLHRGCKLVLVHVADPGELVLRGSALYRYVDMETGEAVICKPDELNPAYMAMVKKRRDALQAMAAARGMLYLPVETNSSFYPLFDTLAR